MANKTTPNKADVKTDKKEIKKPKPIESGGPKGLEPTRYGDWEKGGKCVDF